MQNEHVSRVGILDGQPALEFWRYGVAALGEPSIVTRVEAYANETVRDQALCQAIE